MPKIGHVTDLREQWLVRTDGALAHHLQDREISSHLCENRYRNQQIREDFPLALNEQRDIEHEVRLRELARRRQADIDAEMAREMAEINLRRQRTKQNPEPTPPIPQPCSSKALPPPDIDPEELGLSAAEIEEMRFRLEMEERDARLARALSQGQDELLADMKCAVEAQDGELARLLQQREYKKLQRAKEKAKQKALLKKQQRLQQMPLPEPPQATLCDAYSNPRDMIREGMGVRENGLRLCKSVDSDLNYVEPFEREHIQSKDSALLSKEISKQYYTQEASTSSSNLNISHKHSKSFDTDKSNSSMHHRHPPPPPSTGKKPRFPDPVSIRPASHYPTDNILSDSPNSPNTSLQHSISENNNLYSSTYPPDHSMPQQQGFDRPDPSKRLSVISDITAEGLAKKKSKQADMQKKRRGCKIQ
ncbi:jg9650 [Pararge aegeria aegeria]|uniref:Jg9650 protein n=2 Tax=Pararge aegeria TaxID=116150 RepID=A0A8S4RUR1_9NEOP|nr:jg9650 [Pararge aegeria aegeria]